MKIRMDNGLLIAETMPMSGTHSGRYVKVTVAERDGEDWPPTHPLTGEVVENVLTLEVDGQTILTLYIGNRDVFPDGALVLETRSDTLHTVSPNRRTDVCALVTDCAEEYGGALKDVAILAKHREAWTRENYKAPKLVGRHSAPTRQEMTLAEIRREISDAHKYDRRETLEEVEDANKFEH